MNDLFKSTPIEIGERLKRARFVASITQEDLSLLIKKHFGLNVGRSAISMWENGKTQEISAKNLLAASKILSVNPYWIIFGMEM
jgi:transcriptional regulator with XRE-family HTH domain